MGRGRAFGVVSRRAAIAAGALAALAPAFGRPASAVQPGLIVAGGTVRGVPGKTGEMPGPDVATAPAERWRVALDRGRWSEPVTDGERVYACRAGEGVSAVDLATGAEAWRGGGEALGFDAAPCVAAGLVSAGGERWTLLGLEAASGAEAWRYVREVAFPDAMPTQAADSMATLYGLQFGAPTVADGVAYAGGWSASGDGSNPPTAAKGLYAVDAATGALRWQYPVGSGVMASPAVAADLVYALDLEGIVHAVNAGDGSMRWSGPHLGLLDTGLAVSGGLVFAPTHTEGAGAEPGVAALDAYSGETVWRRPLVGAPVSAPAVSGNLLLLGGRNGRVMAMDATTGADRWAVEVGSRPFPPVFVPGGLVYVSTEGGALHAIDPESGGERWRVEGGAPFASPPLVVGGAVVVADADGALLAFAEERAG